MVTAKVAILLCCLVSVTSFVFHGGAFIKPIRFQHVPASTKLNKDIKLHTTNKRSIFNLDSFPGSDGYAFSSRNELKLKLFALCAACDRGLSAQPAERAEIDKIVSRLRKNSPIKHATRNLYPTTTSPLDTTPLEGTWKLVYTSQHDVIALSSNPLLQVQNVYQAIYRDGSAINVVNLAPRIQSMLPQSLVGDGTVLRLRVFSKAIARNTRQIALSFRRVDLKPLKILNFSVGNILPAIGTRFPPTTLFGNSDDIGLLFEKNTPHHFDILYLDDDCVIVEQTGGGIFISIRSQEAIDTMI